MVAGSGRLRGSPKAVELAPVPGMFPALELPRASLMFLEVLDPKPVPILSRIASSSAPDTLARCFFNGLPRNPPPFRAPLIALDDSRPLVREDDSGGVVDRFDGCGWVSPEGGVFVASPLLLEDSEAAEC